MSEAEAAAISKVFVELLTSTTAKLNRGAQLRREMLVAIRNGRTPTDNYRYQWLVRAANALVSRAAELAQEFNAQNPQDRASADDLMDALARAAALIERKAKKR